MIDQETARRLVLMLDNAMPLFEEAALREFQRENGKTLRAITQQEIAKRARKLLNQAATELNMQDQIEG